MVRAFALSLVVLLVGCGTEPIAAPGGAAPVAAAAAGGAALPVAGPSWVAGDRASPTGGRITVGLLVNAREARRLATLLPKDKLRAFMLRRYPRVEVPEDPVVLEWDDWGAKFRTWGPQGLHLANVRAWFREHHDLDVEFREVLATECEGLPAVVAEQTPVGAHERKALKAYKDAGGRLLVPNELLFPKAGVRRDEGLRTALEDVIATSPFVHALDADPFAVKAHREGDTVVIDFPVAHTKAVLKDAAGRLLTSGLHSGTHDRVHLEAPDPELDPFTHFVVLTHEHDGHSIERAVAVADLVGTLERQVEAPNQVHAGGVLALRIRTSLSHDASPVPGQTGTVALKVSDRIVASTTYTSDANGFAHPRLEVPQRLPSRRATLVIDDVEQTIQITRGWRVSVVTERPLYKQTDKVHVRAMVHRAGDGRPVRNASVELAIGDMKRIVTTSAHGIASHTFELVDHKVGKAAVVARAGDAKTACRFRVKAFERPTFVLAAEPAALTLRPGETAAVTIRATYVNGSPLVGGGFRVDAAEGVPIPEAPEQTSADGTVRLEVTPDSRASSGWFQVSVRDADGRREELVVPVSIESEAIQIAVHPLSDLAVGVPASFELTATRPTTLSLGGVFDGPREVVIDDTGRAVVELTPTRGHTTLRVIDKASGKSIERSLVAALGDEDLTLALNRRTGLVGETIRGTLLGPDGLVRLDVWKDQTAVLTQTVRLEKGRAEIELPLDARMAGVLRVFTRHEDGKLRAPRATLLVTRGRALEVEAKAAAPHYAPGATAAVDVTVRDKDGRPTSAVLGFWGVDEALLALAPMTEGHERIFDVLGEAPRTGLLRTAEGIDRGLPASREAIARPLGDLDKGTNDKRTFALRLARTPQLEQAAKGAFNKAVNEKLERLKKAYVAAWKYIQIIELVRSDALRQTLGWLTGRGAIDADLLLDPWGTPIALWVDRKSVDIQWHSAGPDRRYFTGDDVRTSWSGYHLYDLMPQRTRDFLAYVSEHYDPALDEAEVVTEEPIIRDEELFGERALILEAEMIDARQQADRLAEALGDMPPAGAAFAGPSENGIIGIGGGAGGRFSGRGGSHGGIKYGSAPRPLHVRRDFDPTLIFVPEAIVGPDGKTTLRIPLKDSMTTWRLRLVASRDDGATGVGTGSIRVMQPVHATPWLSPHLTIGDVVSVPVAIRNEEDRAVTARVTATASSHLAELGEVQMSVDIGPGGTGRATFRYRARESGKATVRIVVDTGTAQDVQERVITVHRNARTVVAVANGNVTADAPFDTRMPSDGPGEVRLDLYPSPLAEIVSGFDGLIRAPHG